MIYPDTPPVYLKVILFFSSNYITYSSAEHTLEVLMVYGG